MTLHEMLEKHVKAMVLSMGEYEKGNIYSLIMQEVERSLILLTFQQTKNNYFKSARILGISRSTLYRKLELFALPLKFKVESNKKGRYYEKLV